ASHPSLRIAATKYVLDPAGGDDRRVVSAAVLHDQLADAGEIHRRGTDTASAARRAEAIDGNVSRALGTHRLPQHGDPAIGKSDAACPLQNPTQQVGIG